MLIRPRRAPVRRKNFFAKKENEAQLTIFFPRGLKPNHHDSTSPFQKDPHLPFANKKVDQNET
ncbi:hypothetical protein QQ054_32535 [Oscillatoria amoena NRMC-F 0135]|nr:hypothetical protein [Oscillatoria amoena NRMC-F 0135]